VEEWKSGRIGNHSTGSVLFSSSLDAITRALLTVSESSAEAEGSGVSEEWSKRVEL
jgi:hypothetical protein